MNRKSNCNYLRNFHCVVTSLFRLLSIRLIEFLILRTLRNPLQQNKNNIHSIVLLTFGCLNFKTRETASLISNAKNIYELSGHANHRVVQIGFDVPGKLDVIRRVTCVYLFNTSINFLELREFVLKYLLPVFRIRVNTMARHFNAHIQTRMLFF